MRTKKNKDLAVVANGPPTKMEISNILTEHRSICEAGLTMVQRAMNIGDWFIGCRKRIRTGWRYWLKNDFPQISVRQISNYVRLAEHRQFLEVRFNLKNGQEGSTASHATLDFERVTSIRDCLKAISEIRSPRGRKDKKSMIGPDQKAIDIEATVQPSRDNQEYSRPTKIGLDIESRLELPPDTEVESAPAKSPKEMLTDQLAAYVKLQTQANEVLHQAVEWIENEGVIEADIIEAIKYACQYQSEMTNWVTSVIETERLKLEH